MVERKKRRTRKKKTTTTRKRVYKPVLEKRVVRGKDLEEMNTIQLCTEVINEYFRTILICTEIDTEIMKIIMDKERLKEMNLRELMELKNISDQIKDNRIDKNLKILNLVLQQEVLKQTLTNIVPQGATTLTDNPNRQSEKVIELKKKVQEVMFNKMKEKGLLEFNPEEDEEE